MSTSAFHASVALSRYKMLNMAGASPRHTRKDLLDVLIRFRARCGVPGSRPASGRSPRQVLYPQHTRMHAFAFENESAGRDVVHHELRIQHKVLI